MLSLPVVGGQISPPAIRWNSSSTYVAFATDADTVGKHELYVAPNDGAGSQKVSGSIAEDADVNSFEFVN